MPSFKIGTNLKIILDGEKDKLNVKPKGKGIVKTKPSTDSNKEQKMLNQTSSSKRRQTGCQDDENRT